MEDKQGNQSSSTQVANPQPKSFRDKLMGASPHKYFPNLLMDIAENPELNLVVEPNPLCEDFPLVSWTREQLIKFCKPWSKCLLARTTGLTRPINEIGKHLMGI